MKIYLFLSDRLFAFSLPKDISGSYSFDYNDDEESKLINVEARDSRWVLYSTGESSIMNNNIAIDSVSLQANSFYNIKRGNSEYLIFVEDNKLNSLSIYQYSDNLNLNIGNTNNCNIKYDFGVNEEIEINIFKNNNNLTLKRVKGKVYVNSIFVNDFINLNIGDLITIYGLKLTFLMNIILFNYYSKTIPLIDVQSGIVKYSFPNDEEPINEEVKDVDLYNQNDYYSKSPRIRRLIETKNIKLDSPPNDSKSQEMPLILTIGPMVTMGATSVVTIVNTLSRAAANNTPISEQLPTLIMSGAMLASMLLWPLVTRLYNKHAQKVRMKEILEKYTKYLNEKREELVNEERLQKDIISENLLSVSQCIEIINQRKINFWDKRTDQNDFLVARIGIGDQLLSVNIAYPESGFTIEESELKKQADALVQEFKYIKNIPVSYSFYDNLITAVMGNDYKTVNFINNILLQFLTFYTYEDLKLVVFTNKNNEHNWDYIKYLNHNFDNEKRIRFFASDFDSTKEVLDYLNFELNRRINQRDNDIKPHYLIIIDDYSNVKRHDFIKNLTEQEGNLGFNLIIRENLFKNLPSKCDNFITLNDGKSGILKNSFEGQEQISFTDEIVYNVDMMAVAKILSNIPIEFEEGVGHLPDSISFLEMEKVGKVEQLNILNRWNTNDSTTSLRAEIGVDEQEELMYLDLHEKYHGPHGLIAGTTGSGKSEFIITYIISMCINYSPDDVSFILIDYKGGGLALAFENKNSGVILPHLAGTITNLDKAEMDRTLVSIDSEVKRRQRLFNDARDKLGESTMDIYKYQRHFHDGRLDEPVTHLFIICDEFAELKSQQPEFMDNLISVARIGRSLGVHLILATQKPSGVVNDQIWSNTRFRVCLKVQDESDSKEMLKNPDAAHIKQVGRYYLQVGYDEYYALGQSGWCGAKYYPSNKIVKQVDKSINFINDCGQFIKSIQASRGNKMQAQGEQLGNILNSIIEVSNQVGKKARKLWLDNIPDIIIEDDIEKKYDIKNLPYNFDAVIGEYDAPELQEQGLVVYNLLKDGNSIIYGNDSIEREMFLDTMIYSITKNHSPEELNFYILDFGSEALRKYEKLPHSAGYATINEANRISNLFNIISDEQASRRKIFTNYGGEYAKYITSSDKKMPLLVVIINNFDTFKDNYDNMIYGILPDATRDSDRYGIVYVITAIGSNSVRSSIQQNFKTFFTYKLKDSFDYQMLFGKKKKILPREILGRGILDNGDLHEFQTCYVNNEQNNDFINLYIAKAREKYSNYKLYLPLPLLPDRVRFDDIKNYITDLTKIPLGISADDVEVQYMDFVNNTGIVISASKIDDTVPFTKSLITVFSCFKNINLFVLDANKKLGFSNQQLKNYYIDNFKEVIENLKKYVDSLSASKSEQRGILVINGIDQLLKNLNDENILDELTMALKKYEKICTIFVESNSKFKSYISNKWVKNVVSTGNGVWIGKDCNNQTSIMCNVNRSMSEKIKNDKGFVIVDSSPVMSKILDFYTNNE